MTSKRSSFGASGSIFSSGSYLTAGGSHMVCPRGVSSSSANGAICLDILKDQWSPALSIKTAMLSLQALLSTPEPNDPQDAVVAKQYLDSYEEFVKHAKEWTAKYAT